MTYPEHIQRHHAIGISRVKQCLAYCLFAPVETGTYFSDRFSNKDFENLIDNLRFGLN